MTLTKTPDAHIGMTAPDFELKGVDGEFYTFDDVAGENGTVIMFICNHCPYVKGAIDRIVADMNTLQEKYDIGVAAIMSNDTENYPQDSFENMVEFADQHDFTFPYLIDETQDVAHEYGAVCTPDFFGFDQHGQLQYRGRLDNLGKDGDLDDDRKRELVHAMINVVNGGAGPDADNQMPSMGCNIKWRDQ